MVVAIIARLFLALQDIEFLVTKVLPDDAFYYFTIARNIAQSGKISFDGINLTNGFHPLWMAVVAFLYLLPLGKGIIHGSLVIAGVIYVIGGIPLWRIMKVLGIDDGVSLVVLAAYLMNPFTIFQSINGLETSLSVFLVLLVSYQFITIRSRPPELSRKALINLGISSGFMLLSRTDNIFLYISLLFILSFSSQIQWKFESLLVIGLLTIAIILPWLIWNYIHFGTIVQSSAVAIPYVCRVKWLKATGQKLFSLAALSYVFKIFDGNWHRFMEFGMVTPKLVLAVSVLDLFATFMFRLKRRSMPIKLWNLDFLIAAVIIYISAHSLFRWGYMRDWYFPWLISILYIILGAFASSFLHAVRNLVKSWFHWILVFLATSIFCYTLFNTIVLDAKRARGMIFREKYPWQIGMYQSAQWIRYNTLPTVRIGALNAGIIGYFSERVVINLDGVVNNEALKYIQRQELLLYARQQGISLIVEGEDDIITWQLFWDQGRDIRPELKELHRFQSYERGSPRVIYRLRDNSRNSQEEQSF